MRSRPVSLRSVEEEDLDAIVEYMSEESSWGVRGISKDRYGPMSRSELGAAMKDWPTKEAGQALVIEALGTMVGHVTAEWEWDALTPSIWVFVSTGSRRQGYGRTAAGLLIDRLFLESPASAVHSWVDAPSDQGLGFARALGFTAAGLVRRAGIRDGHYYDSIPMELPRSAWEARREG